MSCLITKSHLNMGKIYYLSKVNWKDTKIIQNTKSKLCRESPV